MSKLGDLLKSEREKRGLSLHEIGMNLKINSKVLKAIEEGDEKNFPAKTFLRGFVKSYAQYLRLDVNQVLQMFQDEFGSTRPEEPKKSEVSSTVSTTVTAPSVSMKQESSSLRRSEDAALPEVSSSRIYTIVGAIVLLMLIAFVAKMMDKYQKESEVSTTEVIAAVEGEAPPTTTESTLPAEVSGSGTGDTSTTSITSTTLTGAAAVVVTTSTTSTSTSTTTSTTVKATTTTTTSTTTTTKASTTTTVRATTTTTTVPGGSTTTTLRSRATEVIVEALNRVTVKFVLNGGATESIELSPDQVHTFRSRGTIQLDINDGGAVNIIVNGRDRGVPGTIGKSIKLTYP